MKILRKSIKDLDVIAYHILHLQIINPMLPVKLTGKEAEVLAHFMSLPPQVADMGRFNSITKKLIRDKMNLSVAGMSNYIKALEKKGCITKDEFNNTLINTHLLPNPSGQGYQFKILRDPKTPSFITIGHTQEEEAQEEIDDLALVTAVKEEESEDTEVFKMNDEDEIRSL